MGAEGALLDWLYRNAANTDGEWGCGHSAEQIRAGHGGGERLPGGCYGANEMAEVLPLVAALVAERDALAARVAATQAVCNDYEGDDMVIDTCCEDNLAICVRAVRKAASEG